MLSLRRIWSLTRREWIQLIREPRTLFVIFMLPLVMLALYGYAVTFDLKEIPFAVYDFDRSNESRDLLDRFTHSDYFKLKYEPESYADANELLRRGRVRFVLVIPKSFGQDLLLAEPVDVQVLLDGADSNTATTAQGYVEGVVRTYSAEMATKLIRKAGAVPGLRLTGIDLRPRVLYNPDLKSTRFIVPGLIAVILTMIAALLTSTTIVREKERGTFEALVASPVRPLELMIGKILPYTFIAFGDTLLSVAAGALMFGIVPQGSVPLLLGISLFFLVGTLGIGLLFSTVAPTQQIALLACFLSTVLPSVLLSGFVFPLASLPWVLQKLAVVIPTTHFLIVSRGIYLKNVGIEVLWPQAVILSAFAVGAILLSALRFRKRL